MYGLINTILLGTIAASVLSFTTLLFIIYFRFNSDKFARKIIRGAIREYNGASNKSPFSSIRKIFGRFISGIKRELSESELDDDAPSYPLYRPEALVPNPFADDNGDNGNTNRGDINGDDTNGKDGDAEELDSDSALNDLVSSLAVDFGTGMVKRVVKSISKNLSDKSNGAETILISEPDNRSRGVLYKGNDPINIRFHGDPRAFAQRRNGSFR